MKSAAILILAGAAVLAVPAAAQQSSGDGLLMNTKWDLETSKARKKAPPAKGTQTANAAEGPQLPPPERQRVPAKRVQRSSSASPSTNTRRTGQKMIGDLLRDRNRNR